MIWPCSGRQVPEIGIERLITGGSHKAHKPLLYVVEDAQVPDAALQCQGPSFHGVGLITTVFEQGIDAGPIRNEIHTHAVAIWEPWGGSLLAKGKQCHSTGVAHAGGDAVDGEQSPAQQLHVAQQVLQSSLDHALAFFIIVGHSFWIQVPLSGQPSTTGTACCSFLSIQRRPEKYSCLPLTFPGKSKIRRAEILTYVNKYFLKYR